LPHEELVGALLAGDRRALARVITLVEYNNSDSRAIVKALYPHSGGARVIGVTGPPGAGKSTLVDQLAREIRSRGKTVAIVAVDPTSPFTGGAILGDRIRMRDVSMDPGVFIRSLATRGHLGGLSRATSDVIKVMDAFGFDVVIVETVGAGQSEVDIVRLAHTTVIVLVPGLGDDIQAIKAGILEIGDVFLVNKADLPGADKALMEIEMMLDLRAEADWRPTVLKVIAREGKGVKDALTRIDEHYGHLEETGGLEGRLLRGSELELKLVLTGEMHRRLSRKEGAEEALRETAARVSRRETDPYSAVESLLTQFGDVSK